MILLVFLLKRLVLKIYWRQILHLFGLVNRSALAHSQFKLVIYLLKSRVCYLENFFWLNLVHLKTLLLTRRFKRTALRSCSIWHIRLRLQHPHQISFGNLNILTKFLIFSNLMKVPELSHCWLRLRNYSLLISKLFLHWVLQHFSCSA